MSDDSIIPLTDDTSNVTFFKKSKIGKNVRKRKKSPSPSASTDVAEEGSAVVTKERKLDTSHPFVQGTKKGKHTEDISVTFSASKSAISSLSQDIATRKAEWDTETDRDAQALLEKKLAAEEADDDNLYKGQNAYKTYIKKRDTAAGNAASSKIKAGPIRAPTNIRVTSRFDYQPDICKDYKETGYCGYGDSCKFLHDRGDYKSGWQLEREWEELQGKIRQDKSEFLIESSDESDDELPFACLICRQEYKTPVVTKNLSDFKNRIDDNMLLIDKLLFFIIMNFTKSPKCYACGAATNGIFNTAKNILQKLEEKKKRLAEKGIEVQQPQQQIDSESSADEE
ncbi:2394_t:CDS:2 [Dentiscutata erythropus]|uniref:Pre-mRNA-splicing factor CWC24 n=1 Tax=Dentiscutata erythropus TaxID=1348616 RepID=A0A9N9CBD5_9GLOM|nr:2394_t:CDS:2 [Dentiscutata erythropus]